MAIDVDPASAMRECNGRPAMLHEFAQVGRAIVPEAPGPIIGIVRAALEDDGARTVFPVSRESQRETQSRTTTA